MQANSTALLCLAVEAAIKGAMARDQMIIEAPRADVVMLGNTLRECSRNEMRIRNAR
jgi:hypothetical protein